LANIEEKVEKIVINPLNDLGYELYDVEYVKEGKDYFLRIYIDSENGIDLNDCERASNSITEILDKEDYIKEQYFLEVSSPGIERVLRKDKHLKQNTGCEIRIKLFRPFERKERIKWNLESIWQWKYYTCNRRKRIKNWKKKHITNKNSI